MARKTNISPAPMKTASSWRSCQCCTPAAYRSIAEGQPREDDYPRSSNTACGAALKRPECDGGDSSGGYREEPSGTRHAASDQGSWRDARRVSGWLSEQALAALLRAEPAGWIQGTVSDRRRTGTGEGQVGHQQGREARRGGSPCRKRGRPAHVVSSVSGNDAPQRRAAPAVPILRRSLGDIAARGNDGTAAGGDAGGRSQESDRRLGLFEARLDGFLCL